MPKISKTILDSTFYLYQTEEDAARGQNTGGTGFLVGVSTSYKNYIHIYAVTNWHCAIRDGFSVIRLNTLDGETDIFDIDPSQWTAHPDGYDIAVTPLNVDITKHKFGVLPTLMFATDEVIERVEIGPGEDVFMIGRFIDHDGGPTNNPSLRFGNLSMMPSPIKQPTGKTNESYCIDLHSRSGYSGSPVFVYRTPGADLSNLNTFSTGDHFMYFLGIHWGQFPEQWEIIGNIEKKESNESGLITEGQYVRGMSGMTCVTPASRIIEVLDMKQFADIREEVDAANFSRTHGHASESAKNTLGVFQNKPSSKKPN